MGWLLEVASKRVIRHMASKRAQHAGSLSAYISASLADCTRGVARSFKTELKQTRVRGMPDDPLELFKNS